jgi:hypothetical protein
VGISIAIRRERRPRVGEDGSRIAPVEHEIEEDTEDGRELAYSQTMSAIVYQEQVTPPHVTWQLCATRMVLSTYLSSRGPLL